MTLNKGRLLPPRPNNKVRNKIGGGGRNECVLHTTKRQKSRVGQESWLDIPYFIIFKFVMLYFKFLSPTIIICFIHINFYLIILIFFVLFKRIVDFFKIFDVKMNLFPDQSIFYVNNFLLCLIIICNLWQFLCFFKDFLRIVIEKKRFK